VPARLDAIRRVLARPPAGPDAILEAVGVKNIVGDARTIDLGRKVDLIVSNNTLEHIPQDVLREMFERFRGLVSEGGIMSHWIDMSDHYIGFDPAIGPYNFLKFPQKLWRLFNNRHQYQNRLRVSDFRRLHATTGWTIIEEDNKLGPADDLRRIPLAEEFRGYGEQDLLVIASWMVSEPVR
jgi:hypothetical protein